MATPLQSFDEFFTGSARQYLVQAITLALDEDGAELTSAGLFSPADILHAQIRAKEATLVAGLPIAHLVIELMHSSVQVDCKVAEGTSVDAFTTVATLQGPAVELLKAERIILNFLTHMSGIANLTRIYRQAMGTSSTILLDTRKTLPGLRYPEKYAVLVGGGANHRKNLEEMLMLKDNHIDRAGSISKAVSALRATYSPCPPIEVECRTMDEIDEAVAAAADRIMLDNMGVEQLRQGLARIPSTIETEISGGVNLSTIGELAQLGATYISVGRITHSAPSADFSMTVNTEGE